MIKKHFKINESPWPFVISTASLFLTFGAVLFFQEILVVENILDSECTQAMMLGGGIVRATKKLIYTAGIAVGNQISRKYSYQSWGYGKTGWDPDNYSFAAQQMMIDFQDGLLNQDKEKIYNTMYAVINNEKSVFTQGYGKVFRNMDSLIYEYNKQTPGNPITEREYLEYHNYSFEASELFFLSSNNRGTITTNIQEILAAKVMMQKNSMMLVERASQMQDKINLSGQKEPEYTIGMFVANQGETTNLVVYDSDLKTTNDDSLYKKLADLELERRLNIVKIGGKQSFGFNIFVVALKDSNADTVILSPEQTKLIDELIQDQIKENPGLFLNFDSRSEIYQRFLLSGNTKYLNQLNVPSPRFIIPQDFKDLMHKKEDFYNSNVYKQLINLTDDPS